MFDALRKKIGGWFGTGKEEAKSEKEKPEKSKEKRKEKAAKKQEKTEKKVKSQKPKKERVEKKIEKASKKIEKKEKAVEVKKLKDEASEEKEAEKEEKRTQRKEISEEEVEEVSEEEVEEVSEEEVEEASEEEPAQTKSEEIKEKKETGDENKENKKEEGWLAKWWKKREEIAERDSGELEEAEEQAKVEIKEEVEIKDNDIEEAEEGFFARLKKKLVSGELKQEEFEEIFQELEITLLENNVALEVVDKIKENLGKSLVNTSVKKSEIEGKIKDSLKVAILSVLIEGEDIVDKIKESKESPFVILFFGINGTGKTTSIAKVAHNLKEEGISCVLAAGDTFRAASIEQLEKHAEKIGVPIVKSDYNSDPASVGFEAISYAKKHRIKVVLIDTAGRMYTRSNLMKEMEKIVKVTKPNLKIFVGESITGNDATQQAKMFSETAGIDGIILTKADVDEKAGAILSVSYVTGKPIFYLGVGQEYKDLQIFKKIDVLKGLGLE